jgi:rfaE bifunctional protein nucleotidyltransferase chain/domain
MASPPLIVLAHGCFDVFHPGHLAMLEEAKRFGDKLVVSVTSDQYVRQQKGPLRPYFPLAERVTMLSALRIVDEVIMSDAPDAVAVITKLRPAFYAKGADYAATPDTSGRLDLERNAVERLGGQVIFIDAWPRYSSTAILKALA